jgi:CheY-like chemotaxis protein
VYRNCDEAHIRVRYEKTNGSAVTQWLGYIIYKKLTHTSATARPLQHWGLSEMDDLMRSTILLIQDDRDFSTCVTEALCDAETDVIQCSTVQEAVYALESSPEIELLLAAVQVPGLLDGYELAEIVRAFKPTMPIILTSTSSESRQEKLPSSSTLLRKPCSVEEVLKLVLEQLGQPPAAPKANRGVI